MSLILIGRAVAGPDDTLPAADLAYDGKWTAVIVGADGKRHVGKVVIADFAGTWVGWLGRPLSSAFPCNARRVPLTVQESSTAELTFTVWGSAVSPACPDRQMTFRPIAKNVVQAQVDALGDVTLGRR